MKVLIIGGAGLLGSSLSELLLKKGYDVSIVDNFSGSLIKHVKKEVKTFSVDCTDTNNLNYVFLKCRPDIVINCSNFFYNYEEELYREEREISFICNSAISLAYCLKNKGGSNVKLVVSCTSSEVYGVSTCKPDTILKGEVNNRGNAYRFHEAILNGVGKEQGINVALVRVFEMYGERVRYTPITGKLNFIIDANLKGTQISLTSSNFKYDFVSCKEVSKKIIKIVKDNKSVIYNAGSGSFVKVKDICNQISEFTQSPNYIIYNKDNKRNFKSNSCSASTISYDIEGLISNRSKLLK